MGYFGDIYSVTKSILTGMGITLKHFMNPKTIITVQYKRPERRGEGSGHELPKIPELHKGLHYLETEECILCWQCANICPVDCIKIEGTRDGDIDGAYQANRAVISRFTIDYALCIYCNLCCEACPDSATCIHMGQEFDFSSYDQGSLVKNLLADRAFTKQDLFFTVKAQREIDRLAEEKKQAAEAKRAAMAAKKAAAAKAKAPAKKDAPAAAKKDAPAKPDAKKAE